MKRIKRHKIKQETPESSTSRRDQQEHDLAYYIHDRVELMHQVFSVIKPKELKVMAPECVHHITVDDLQELCTEELLGISSKRLCAILDGADPPTDTESSSSEHNIETISLDSISSDDEVLSQHSSKKKHKHKKHKTRGKHKRKTSRGSDKGEPQTRDEQDRSKASRAGLTVLELLELQARARAIRAQLHQDNATATPAGPKPSETKQKDATSEDEVEIKEEPAEVVEISSEDEKPKIEDLPVKPPSPSKEPQTPGNSKTVTKITKDLIISVPQTKPIKKIVLNRKKTVAKTITQVSKPKHSSSKEDTTTSKTASIDTATQAKACSSKENVTEAVTQQVNKVTEVENNKVQLKPVNNKSKHKKKQKKKDKKSDKEEDHYEITLQLSDTEKMDLLEDLDRKNFENFTSSSEDSESSSENDSEKNASQDSTLISQSGSTSQEKGDIIKAHEVTIIPDKDIITSDNEKLLTECVEKVDTDVNIENKEVNIIELELFPKDTREEREDLNEIKSSITIDPVQNYPKDWNENGTLDKSPNKDIDIIMNTNISSNKSPNKVTIVELDPNKSLNVEIISSESTEPSTMAESQREAVKSIIVQLRNESYSNSEPNMPQQAVESVISRKKYTKEQGDVYINKDLHVEKTNDNMNTVESDLKTTDTNNEDGGSIEEGEITNTDLSDGEIPDCEANTQINYINSLNKSGVVCVSDKDGDQLKKKKKKDKKSKKEKKSKKSKSDFRKGADQNFFRKGDDSVVVIQEDIIEQLDEQAKDGNTIVLDIQGENYKQVDDVVPLDDDDDIYEFLEISDDSSCYEVEGITVSKEPTAVEIAALSAKIDEIHTNDVVIINEEVEIGENEKNLENICEEIDNISWHDRYLGSKKVKRVLTTSNMLNALRNKNKELKRKLEESNEKIEDVQETEKNKQVLAKIGDFVEGSIEHFNTLQGSSKYVDHIVPEVPEESNKGPDSEVKDPVAGIEGVTKEMEKDAKQLLKMYKRLMKYNDINKKKDPNKKKKKKHKKSKEKEVSLSEK